MEVKSLRKRWILVSVKRYVLLSLSSQAVVWDTMTIYLVSSHPASSPLVIQSKLHTWLLCRLKALLSTVSDSAKGSNGLHSSHMQLIADLSQIVISSIFNSAFHQVSTS